jgi:hypothetical protein
MDLALRSTKLMNLLKGCSKDLFHVGKITYHSIGYTAQDIGSVLLFLLSLALFQSSTNRRLTLCFVPVPPSHLTLRSGPVTHLAGGQSREQGSDRRRMAGVGQTPATTHEKSVW